MDYALIKDGTVQNIIVADADFIVLITPGWDHIEPARDGAGPGWGWDGTDFIAPPQPELPAPVRHVSVGAFFDRFGPLKWAILADTTPQVQAVVKDASVRAYIDLDNADLPAGLALLQAAGHAIDPEAVVDAPIRPEELP